MYFLLAVPILIIAGAAVCNKKDASFKGLESDEHPLKSLYPLASVIYDIIKKNKKEDVFGNMDILREIYVDERPENARKKQGCKCIASVLAVLGLTFLVCFLYTFSRESILTDNNHLKRNEAGKGDEKYNLILKSVLTDEQDYTVRVSERELKGEEFEKLKAEAQYYIDKMIFDPNESAECVRGKINLITEIPGTSVRINWTDDNSWFLSVDGKVKNKDYTEPVPATLHAELTYFDRLWDYYLDIMIYPPDVTEKDRFLEELEESLKEADIATRTENYYELPERIGDKELSWNEEEDNTSVMFLIIGLIAAGAVLPAMKQDIHKKQKKRIEQMMQDYPDIISKFVMLITAGMTCRGAWNKICSDYRKKRERDEGGEKKNGNKRTGMRFAYEEMLISDREMQLGIPEVKVYERFGTRCSVPAYNRFGTLLARNIKRGSSGIIEILESESKESFAERRENVRKKGEETGTKLLLPMFGMLILVIAIVVVPAFSSF